MKKSSHDFAQQHLLLLVLNPHAVPAEFSYELQLAAFAVSVVPLAL